MKVRLEKYDWKKIQSDHDGGMNMIEIRKKYKMTRSVMARAADKGLFVKIHHPFSHSYETKKYLSEKRKQYLKNNPEKHPWKKRTKFKSAPCEEFKKTLKSEGINFIPEYEPLEDRFFSIDIGFPEKKLGIEINGNQHYNKDKTLKEYYLKRHNEIINSGWKLIEIHYSLVYNTDFVNRLISEIKNEKDRFNFNVDEYEFKILSKKVHKCKKCKKIVSEKGKMCPECSAKSRRVVDRPTKEELEKMIHSMPMTHIGKYFNVSDNAIRNWCNQYEIRWKKQIRKVAGAEGIEPSLSR